MMMWMMMMMMFYGRHVSVFECSVMSEVFKALVVKMTGGELSHPALLIHFGPFHRLARKQERVLTLRWPCAQSILIVLTQFQTRHFGWDARHGLVHLALFRVQDTRVALSEQLGLATTFFRDVSHPVWLDSRGQKGMMISSRFLVSGSYTFAPVHCAGREDGWDDTTEPLSGPWGHQRLRVGVVNANAAWRFAAELIGPGFGFGLSLERDK